MVTLLYVPGQATHHVGSSVSSEVMASKVGGRHGDVF
jgi:hypothetical protein